MAVPPDSQLIHSWLQLALVLEKSEDPALGVSDSLFSIDQLIKHGCHDAARRIIDRLAAKNFRNETFQLRLQKLEAASVQIQRIPELKNPLVAPRISERLLSFQSLLLTRGDVARQMVVVYATPCNNFDVSFPFLHCLLSGQADSILYVKNPARGMYTTGNLDYGRSIDEMSSGICRLISRLRPARLSVMGFSGGGYAALHLAAMAGANRFLGFNIKTDWSRGSSFPIVADRASPAVADYANNTLMNMLHLPEIKNIEKSILYFGEKDPSDTEHALEMSGLPNFDVRPVRHGSHNLIFDFLGAGILPNALYEVLG